MITNNSNKYYVFLNVFMFRVMSMTLRNINPQKEIFHHYDFPVYTTSKYRDPKLDTYRRITHKSAWWIFTQLYFCGGESWPNYLEMRWINGESWPNDFDEKVNRGEYVGEYNI